MSRRPKIKLSELLDEIEKIAAWFEARDDIDVEEGLKKVKEGSAILKVVKGRLKEVENQFEEVKKTI